MTKICLIGLPRCGSQYISSIICSNSDVKIRDLVEPFTIDHHSAADLVGKENLPFLNYEDQVQKVIEQITDIDRPVILKLFLNSNVSLNYHKQIVCTLQSMGFTFAIIKRNNVLDQVLSLGVGLTVDKFTNFDEYDNSIVTINQSVMNEMKVLQSDIGVFDHLLNELGLSNSPILHYDTIKMDLIKFLKKPINIHTTSYKKMSSIRSAQRISNIDEVLKFLNT